MIKNFDDLFAKMESDGLGTTVIKDRLAQLEETKKNWERAREQLYFDEADRFRHERGKQMNYIMGYLSCMEDLRYLTPQEGNTLFHIANGTN